MAPRRRANCQICERVESKYACPACAVLYCSVACYKSHKSSSCSAALMLSGPSSDMKTAQQGSADAIDNDNNASQTKGKANTASSDLLHLPQESFGVGEGGVSSLGTTPHLSQRDGLDIIAGNHQLGVDDASVKLGNNVEEEGKGEGTVETDSTKIDAPQPLRKLSSLKWPYIPEMSSYPDPLTRDDPKPLTLAQYEAIARSPAVRTAIAAHTRLPTLLRTLDTLRGPARETAVQRVLGVAPSQSSGFTLAGLSASSQVHTPYVSGSYGGRGRGRGAGGPGRNEMEVEPDEEDMRALRALAEAVEGAVRATDSGTSARSRLDPLGLDWEGMES